ncbi:MAG: peptidase MA family metallohydrolase [Dehalococcoidia bacterium]
MDGDTGRRRQREAGVAGWRAGSWPALPLVLVLLAAALVAAWPAVAHAAPEAGTPTTTSEDPSGITFRVEVSTEANLASATLDYRVLNPDGVVGGSIDAEVTAGSTVTLDARLNTNNNERYIPVGTRFAYSWTLVDEEGEITTTPEEEVVFLDGRYEWQSRTEGNVTVYWYGSSDEDAILAMEAAVGAIGDIEALLRVELPYPIRLVIWRNTEESEAAQQPRAATFDQQVITGGARVTSDVIHVYDPLSDFVDVTRHEAAHLVTKVAGDGPFTSIPSWLDEGTAVYAQVQPGRGYEGAVEAAIQSNQVTRLRAMASPANRPDLVNLHYGQSWHTVRYMIDTYGEEDFARIFDEVKAGSPIDEALQTVIGMDQDGLYNAWRESVGLEPIDYEPVARATSAAAQATRPPLRIPTSVTASTPETAAEEGASDDNGAEEAAGGSDTGPMTALVVGALTLLLAGSLGFMGLRLARSR